MQASGKFPSLTHACVSDEQGTHTLLIAMCLHTQAASKKEESVGRVCPLHHLVGTVSMCLSVSLRLGSCAPIRLVMMCAVLVMGRSTYRCVVSVTCVFARVSPAAAEILAVLQNIFPVGMENRSVQLAVFSRAVFGNDIFDGLGRDGNAT